MSALASSPTYGPLGALLRLVARAATRLGLVVMFSVSATLLMTFGYQYMSSGGNLLTKIHPATYLLTIAVAAHLLSEGVGRPIAQTFGRYPGFVAQCCGFVVLAYSCVMVQRYPPSQIVDTFYSGLLVFLLLSRMGQKDKTWLAWFMHALFTVNGLLALVEMVTPFRLVPIYLGDELVTYEWRATALFGHPLSNAALTGVYVLLLTGPAGRIFPTPVRLGLLGIQLAAMMAFGGRAALVLLGLFLALRGGLQTIRILSGRRFSRGTTLLAVLFFTAGLIGAVVFLEAGLFDRFLARFVEDNGSAGTREAMLRVFDHIHPAYFLFGPEPWLIQAAQFRVGTTIAIESFVVGFVALYGLLVSLFFFSTLALFMLEVVRFSGIGAVAPLSFFFIVAAGANSISAKTTDLSMVMALCMVLLTAFRDQAPSSSASRRRAMSQRMAGSPAVTESPSAAISKPGIATGAA